VKPFEFWAKKRIPFGLIIDVTIIAYGATLADARAKVDALGVYHDVAAFMPMSEHL